MGAKFIPNGDYQFQQMARNFARNIAADPERVSVSVEESAALSEAVERFADALRANRGSSDRSTLGTRLKNKARAEAEGMIRRLANRIRALDDVDEQIRFVLNLPGRARRSKRQMCPQEPPRLMFLRALHEATAATPMHELAFYPLDLNSQQKPPGAVRLELFVDLVPPDEPIPAHPGANAGGRPWYLRSFTRSPIRVVPPIARVPMRVVYWARWADSTGNTGPFSATTAAWIEGGTKFAVAPTLLGGSRPAPQLPDAVHPAGRDPTYTVAVIEAHYQCLLQQNTAPPALEAPRDENLKQIEGPAKQAA